MNKICLQFAIFIVSLSSVAPFFGNSLLRGNVSLPQIQTLVKIQICKYKYTNTCFAINKLSETTLSLARATLVLCPRGVPGLQLPFWLPPKVIDLLVLRLWLTCKFPTNKFLINFNVRGTDFILLSKTHFTPNPEQQHIIVLLSRADCTDFIALYRTICLSEVALISLLLIIGIIIGMICYSWTAFLIHYAGVEQKTSGNIDTYKKPVYSKYWC